MNWFDIDPSFGLPFALAASVAAILYGVTTSFKIVSLNAGTPKMRQIADAIAEGASAYIRRKYIVFSVVALTLFFVVWRFISPTSAVGFGVGAIASAASGFIGMNISVRANVRSAQAANRGLGSALKVAFAGGAVTGLLVVGLSLLAVAGFFGATGDIESLISLGLGGSLISIFARLGGGIYAKGTAFGASLIGKTETGIPEADPRNPATIADSVGDNAHDCAGMAADLFETYAIVLIAGMLLGFQIFPASMGAVLFPIVLGSIGLIATIIGTFFVKLPKNRSIKGALFTGLIVTAALSASGYYPATIIMLNANGIIDPIKIYLSSLIGIAVTLLIVALSEYYSSAKFNPDKNLAKAPLVGSGTNINSQFALSQRSTFLPMVVLTSAILVSFFLAGIYGVAITAVSMLSLAGIIISIGAYGPIAHNAQGITQMANVPVKIKNIIDSLDAVGSNAITLTKSYAIASATLAALVLFAVFAQEIAKLGQNATFSLSSPNVLAGLLIGASLPYVFASYTLTAVSIAGRVLAEEIRHQFKKYPGIPTGKDKPRDDYIVDNVVKKALVMMIVPSLIPVIAPPIVGFGLGIEALGGLLIGSTISGFFVAASMTTTGAAGERSKDTLGTAINPLIKIINIVALLLVPFLV